MNAFPEHLAYAVLGVSDSGSRPCRDGPGVDVDAFDGPGDDPEGEACLTVVGRDQVAVSGRGDRREPATRRHLGVVDGHAEHDPVDPDGADRRGGVQRRPAEVVDGRQGAERRC